MKSRRVKATAKSKAFISKKKLKGNLPLDISDSGSDIDSESFFHDEIDDFHKDEEDQLSTDDELIQHKDESSEEEEVLPITDDEKDDFVEDQLDTDESDHSSYYDDSDESDSDAAYLEEGAGAAKAEADGPNFCEEVKPITDDEKDDFGEDQFKTDESDHSSDYDDSDESDSNADDSGKDQFKKDEADDSSDSDESDSDADLPNLEAWGKRKSMYYNADFVDKDRGRTYREEDAEAAKAEADEGFSIQNRIYDHVTTFEEKNCSQDSELSEDEKYKEEGKSATKYEKIKSQDSEISEDKEFKEEGKSATKYEKIKLLKTKNPEMFDLINDFKPSMYSIPNKLPYLLSLSKDKNLPLEAAAEFIKIKYQLLLHYTANILFYMSLKARNVDLHHHPVQKKLSTYKKIVSHLDSIDDAVDKNDVQMFVDKVNEMQRTMMKDSPQKENVIKKYSISQSMSDSAKPTEEKVKTKKFKKVMVATENEMEIMSVIQAAMKKRRAEKNKDETVSDSAKPTEERVKAKKSKRQMNDTETEMELMSLIGNMKAEIKRRRIEKNQDEIQEIVNLAEPIDGQELAEPMNDQEDNQMDEKRTITYQIAKNKGLAPRRKKEYRNPRVKHRMKFRKAKIRRKGQVREVVKEIKRYGGEPTGISTHVVKSIKLK